LFLLQLSHLRRRLFEGPTDNDWLRLTKLLAGMRYSAHVTYADGKPSAIRFHDCGNGQVSLCIVPEPAPSFAYSDA
jgi:hypothetical protein